MRLLTYEPVHTAERRIGAATDEGIVDLAKAYTDHLAAKGEQAPRELADARLGTNMMEFVQRGTTVREAAATAVEHAIGGGADHVGDGADQLLTAMTEADVRPPLPPESSNKIISAGMNYSEHLEEAGRDASGPDLPVAFVTFPSALVGHGDDIVVREKPTTLDRYDFEFGTVDYEAELAVVVGRRANDVEIDDALEYVYGYTAFNDVSERSLQRSEMEYDLMTAGKNLDTFGPIGPWITTADEIPDPGDLDISLTVNGETRQDSNTEYLIYDVADLVSYWSSVMTLYPGDVITTGTPSGVAIGRDDPEEYYLQPGDEVAVEIEGVGRLVNNVVVGER